MKQSARPRDHAASSYIPPSPSVTLGGVHIPHPLVLVQVEPMEIRLTYASTVGAEEGGKGSSDAGSELEEPFRVYRRD